MVTEYDNTRFGTGRFVIAIKLDNKDIHRRDCFGNLAGAFECKILFLGYAFINVVVNEALLFFVITIQPYLMVGIVRVYSLG